METDRQKYTREARSSKKAVLALGIECELERASKCKSSGETHVFCKRTGITGVNVCATSAKWNLYSTILRQTWNHDLWRRRTQQGLLYEW